MPYAETRDGTRLYVKDWGSGRPVVLVHGWPLNADMWEYQAVRLAEAGYRVIAYDRRGFGRSEQPFSGYDYDSFADDLDTVMSAMGVADATLVGFSMGGGEVARYMSRHGGRGIVKAALVGAITPYLLKTDDNPDGVDQDVARQIIDGLREDRPAFLADFGKMFYGVGLISRPVSQHLLDWTLMLALQASPKATIDCVAAFATTDFREDMAAFNVPTLIIHGTSDQIVPIDATGRVAARSVRLARLNEYDGAPHGLFITEKERLSEDLRKFVAE